MSDQLDAEREGALEETSSTVKSNKGIADGNSVAAIETFHTGRLMVIAKCHLFKNLVLRKALYI